MTGRSPAGTVGTWGTPFSSAPVSRRSRASNVKPVVSGAASPAWERLADHGMRRMPADTASSDSSSSASITSRTRMHKRHLRRLCMQRFLWRGSVVGVLLVMGLVVTVVWVGMAEPAHAAKLERLRIAVAPLGWDTNFNWLGPRSSNLDKRPALEFLVGIDRHTGAYIPELAEKWEMAPDGKSWTVWLRQGVKFHENWGEFTAKDVRHAVFLISQPESVQTDAGFWRPLMGIGKADSVEEVAKKVAEGVEIIDDYTVVFHLKQATPEFVENISANTDLVMESKARWDTGGKELYGQKVVGTGPFEFVERKLSSHVLYKRVDNHWRKTPEYKELELRWVPEGVTRLATLLT